MTAQRKGETSGRPSGVREKWPQGGQALGRCPQESATPPATPSATPCGAPRQSGGVALCTARSPALAPRLPSTTVCAPG